MTSPSKAGVKGLGLTARNLSLGFIMSPVIPLASPTGRGHLSGRKGPASKFGSVFCSVSTLTLGDGLEVSLRNTATKVGRRYGAGARKLCPKKWSES